MRPSTPLRGDLFHQAVNQAHGSVRLRLQLSSDGTYQVISFAFVGVAREFPTAPHDSFIVANATYVVWQTGTPLHADAVGPRKWVTLPQMLRDL